MRSPAPAPRLADGECQRSSCAGSTRKSGRFGACRGVGARTVLGRLIESMLMGLLANGALLIESLPGLAKTRTVKTLCTPGPLRTRDVEGS
jgi:hypothetical protein